ncbi:hypothetical protein NIES4071_55670 [Calothrix sp. NIES-4071]|nr:hypothetical protein NIES4071_55670 [Calothrix sp. NIES-4071]BAZ59874.1 hypothetical protein NIES4105_55620 [Calothrix sp. NIES-4105]
MFMSSKLNINQDISEKAFNTLVLSLNVLVTLILSSIVAIPAQATSLKNIPFVEQLKPNQSQNENTSLNSQLPQIVPNSSKIISKNPESQNDIESRLLQEAQDTINEVKEANQVTTETINGKTVYLHKLETIEASSTGNNPDISVTNQISWRLPAPKVRKVPEPATGTGLLLALALFVVRGKRSKAKAPAPE